MAAPTFIAAGTDVGSAYAVTVSPPASYAVGDILVLFCENMNGGITLPSGWSQVDNFPQYSNTGSNTTRTNINAFWKVASASEGGVTLNDAGNHTYAVIIAVRGADPSGPNVTSGGTTGVGTSLSITGATTTKDNCLVVIAASRGNDSAAADYSAWTNANLSSLTQQFDAGTTAGNGGGIGIATGVMATAGNYGTTTATVASSANGWGTIAFKPGNATPSAPTLISPSNGGIVTSVTPQLGFTSTDSDSDDLTYEIQIDLNNIFNSQG